MIDAKEAFTISLQDRANLIKIVIGGLILSVPIIGDIIAHGYLVRYLRLLLITDDKKLPPWTDILGIFYISLKLVAIWIIYCSPLIILSFMLEPYYPLNLQEMATSIKIRAIISLPFVLFIKFFLNIAYIRFAQNNFIISKSLNIRKVFNLIKTNIKDYKVVYVYDSILFIIIIINLVVFVSYDGWIINIIQVLIGIFLFYAYLAIYNMLGMVFRTSSSSKLR